MCVRACVCAWVFPCTARHYINYMLQICSPTRSLCYVYVMCNELIFSFVYASVGRACPPPPPPITCPPCRALRHCIASFLTEITREQHTSEVGWKVPLSVMQKFQDLADDGNSQKYHTHAHTHTHTHTHTRTAHTHTHARMRTHTHTHMHTTWQPEGDKGEIFCPTMSAHSYVSGSWRPLEQRHCPQSQMTQNQHSSVTSHPPSSTHHHHQREHPRITKM